MRKYLVAAVLGAMLVAGEAAASESAVVNAGDRLGSPSAAASELTGSGSLWIAFVAAAFLGLVVWGASQNGGHGHPASP